LATDRLPTAQLTRAARTTLQRLADQDLPPIPANYETVYRAVAREMGLPAAVLDLASKSSSGAAAPHAPASASDPAVQALHLVLRLGAIDGILPGPLGMLMERSAQMVERAFDRDTAKVLLAALQSAARRTLAGQYDFDVDELLSASAKGSTIPVAGPDERLPERVLDVVVRLTLARGKLPARSRGTLKRVTKLARQNALRHRIDQVVEALSACVAAGAAGAVASAGAPSAEAGEGDLAHAHHEAALELLALIRHGVEDSPQAEQLIESMGIALRNESDPAMVLSRTRTCVDALASFFAAIPTQRELSRRLSESALDSVRFTIQASGVLAGRVKRTFARISRPIEPEQLPEIQRELVAEARALHKDALGLKSGIAGVCEPAWRTHAELVDMDQGLAGEQSVVMVDHMTGMPNRAGLQDWLDRVITSETGVTLPFSCAVVELDTLGEVNVDHGRAAGDEVLAEMAVRVHSALTELAFACRSGGEEFTIVLPGSDLNAAEAAAMAAMKAAKDAPFTTSSGRVTSTASAGVSELRRKEKAQSAVRRAVHALHLAKAKGGDRCRSEEDLERTATRPP